MSPKSVKIRAGGLDFDAGEPAPMSMIETSGGQRLVLDNDRDHMDVGEDDADKLDPPVPSDSDVDSESDLDPEQLKKVHLTTTKIHEGEFDLEEMHCGESLVFQCIRLLSLNPKEGRLNASAMDAIRAHNFKFNIDMGSWAYDKMKCAFPQLHDLPSPYQLQACIGIAFLLGIKPVMYHCCKQLCYCFVIPFEGLDLCPY
jgi:hypothetical protein